MNKLKLIQRMLIVLLTATAANNSYAYISHDYKAYVGLGMLRSFQWNKSSQIQIRGNNDPIYVASTQYKPYMDAGSTVVGFNLKNIGIELGYEKFKKIYYPVFLAPESGADPVYGRQSGDNAFVDLILYHQIYNNFVAKIHMGAGFLTTKYKLYANFFIADGPVGYSTQQIPVFSSERWEYRAGFGLQWNFARRWSTEFNYMFQNGNRLIDYLQTMRIGINYYVFCF